MRIELAHGDITTFAVDAIVNAANNALLGGGGVDGAIHRAGGAAILDECRELRRTTLPDGLPTGRAIATGAGRLKARWVIHTVGPVYSKSEDRSDLLRSCYRESLAVAEDLGAETVAFPLISAGVFGWPKEDAIRQALDVLLGAAAEATDAAPSSVREVTLVLFDSATFELARRLRG
jgi:O-acetyl-ADP-ribose deacetylase (regulator of RNase III)